MNILNLTQHRATPEQIAAGVIDPDDEVREAISALLTFDLLPSRQDVEDRAADLAALAALGDCRTTEDDAVLYEHVMIGGAPWLMAPLEAALLAQGLTPVYAFSRRESVDVTQPDGSVTKTAVFRHAGWVRTA